MSWINDTASLYQRVFTGAGPLTLRGWPIAVTVILYTVLLQRLMELTMRLDGGEGVAGLVGGVAVMLAMAACVSSWLALIATLLSSGRVSLADVPASFGVYFGDLLSVAFLVFLLQFVADLVLAPFVLLRIVFALATLAFFNAVPELIYLGRHRGAELLMASYRFIGENWVEWFPANVGLLVIALVVGLLVPDGPYGLLSGFGAGFVVTYSWIVRGLLFLELTTSSRRGREFKRQAAM